MPIQSISNKFLRRGQKGIALLLVLSSIVILTMIAVEFAYNAQVEYRSALRQRERLQAYYLANSAYNLTLLELKVGSGVQSQVASFASQAKVQLPVDLSAPLCQQFPIKTALFRLLMAGKTEEGETASILATLPMQGLEDFLQFEGDFDGECLDESSKIDLNFFYAQDPSKRVEGADNAYDEYKKFIIGILSQPQYKELLEEEEIKVLEVVRNIADWIDPNENINEFGGAEGGGEDSVYQGRPSGQMATKNGKMSIPQDIFQVEGIEDSWWIPVSEMFTIYGITSQQGKPQINVCRAPNEVVRAMILRYTETRTDLPPLKAEDEEVLGQLIQTVKEGCIGPQPDKNKMAQDLDAKLLELLKASPSAPPSGSAAAGTGGYPQTASLFADWIGTQSRFFTLNASGQLNDTTVRIRAVIDLGQAGGSNVTQWKTVYWKVE